MAFSSSDRTPAKPSSKAAGRAPKVAYQCSDCGWETGKWVGRCGECQAWGTVVERSAPRSRVQAGPVTAPARPIGEVPIEDSQARSSGVPELDRVLGGGLVPGAAILLAGEPGVGKSTLLLEVAAQTARLRHRVLYVTGEESAAQVRMRADRTGGIFPELYLAAETDLGAVLGHVEEVKPTLLVIDSVQTISAGDVDGVPGGVTQVKEVSAALIRMAKLRNITLVIIGHVTKDGSIAGPRVLEHLVDVVLQFEGERTSRLRMVRAVKNRYGPVDEVGCFDLSATGIVAITDPTGLFLDARHGPVPGTCVAVSMEGRRPLLSEVQALVTHSPNERPRRTCSGVDHARVALILAVLQQHAGIRLHAHDVFVSSVGGARLTEPSNDAAIALAIVSAYLGRPLGRDIVAIGELGLSGELRRVRDLGARLAEAGRMGFRQAFMPAETPRSAGQSKVLDGLRVVEVDHVRRALDLLGLQREDPSSRGDTGRPFTLH
ncbi:DNA repair protein RadA [Nocardioides aurantiacus]|uniref:DNA repair protein RadA n=1 Tax=Nocardioides aurantiacus TaxID=86796 RepID=A0A3N2CPX7_9ACTN|nr:DNA repair protein RadA [Nocardioides aurantiacus]ROR89468.1 DNA repair protein RadA/Sms [Nocardioides aurantiacus]